MFIFVHKKTIILTSFVFLFAVFLWLYCSGHLFFLASAKEYPRLPIIMYHQVTNKPGVLNSYTISKDQFESDLKYLKDHGFTSISVQQVIDYEKNGTKLPDKPIMITFDDGFESFYAYAYPLLEKYQMKAIACVTGIYIDKFSQLDDHNLNYSHLTWTEITELSKNPLIEIGNHTYNLHKSDYKRRGCCINHNEDVHSYQQLLSQDLSMCQNKVKDATGSAPVVFAYPFGSKCDEAKEVIKKMGFKAILTCYGHINQLGKDKDWIYNLGRYNRVPGKSSYAFFHAIFKNL